jgi:hypothetical protein
MTVDIYIKSIESNEVPGRLITLRQFIFITVPDAIETMAYGLLAYKYKKKHLIFRFIYPSYWTL